jgi:hypothetical protein
MRPCRSPAGGPVFTLPGDLHHQPEPAELVELDRTARTLDPWSVYRRYGADDARDRQEVERYVDAFLDSDITELALQRLAVTGPFGPTVTVGPNQTARTKRLTRPTTWTALQRWR